MMRFSSNRQDKDLFVDHIYFDIEQSKKNVLEQEIKTYPSEKLLNTSTDALIEYFIAKYQFEVPVLDKEKISSDVEEVQQDISADPRYNIYPRGYGSHHLAATKITIEIPFMGDKNFFQIRPSSFSFSPPRGMISESMLTFSVQDIQLNNIDVQRQIDRNILEIEKYLECLRTDANNFNSSLEKFIQTQVSKRKTKLLNDRNLLTSLPYKIKARADADLTYPSPQIRKKFPISAPSASTTPYQPEPVLAEEQYEEILKIIDNMSHVMEHSPSAFKNLGEEGIRSHFLIQLNGQYEGNATGETFNYEGKTDILVKDKGKNIFIAECKFWHGEKGFLETIDQLLGYLSWRDTKAAIFVFNRNKDFSAVLETIKETTKSHSNCKAFIKQRSETSYQYRFVHRDDPNREMIITIMAFNIPT